MPRKMITQAALGLALTLSSFSMWLSAQQALQAYTNLVTLSLFLGATIFFLALGALVCFLIEEAVPTALASLGASLVPLLVLDISTSSLLIPPAMFIGLLFFHWRIQGEKGLYLKPNLRHLLPRPFGILISLVAVLLSVGLYSELLTNPLEFRLSIPDNLFDSIAKNLTGQVGVQLENGAQLEDARLITDSLLNDLISQYRSLIPTALALSFFFTFETGGFVIKHLAIAVAVLFLALLEAAGVVVKRVEKREVEVIEIKS